MKFANKYKSFLAAVLCTSVLTACSSNDKEIKTEKQSTITVTDATGEVTIPAKAERVLAPNAEDSLVALGVTPVAQWSISSDVKDYLQNTLGEIPAVEWNLPLEQAIEAEPDLIIFSSPSAVPTGQLEEYKKVAPTYVFKDEDFVDWRKQISVLGTILGKEKEANKALSDYEKTVTTASKEIKEAIGNESVAAMWVVGGQYYLMENNRFAGNVLYGDLGITQPKMVQKMGSANDATWSPVSLEALADLDADHVFLIASEGEAGITALQKSSLWTAKKHKVYELAMDDSWTVNGKIASEKVIADLKEILIK